MPTNESIASVVDKAWEEKSLKEILAASPAALQGVTEADAQLLDQALGIKTVEAMGTNKFFLWAQALVTLAAQEK